MSRARLLTIVAPVGVLVFAIFWAIPSIARAAWVNTAGQFQVGGQLTQVVPTAAGTSLGATSFLSPTCGAQGGTSLALVPTLLQGLRVAGVNPVLNPIALVVSCLDNGASATIRSRLNFINPADGTVIAQISTNPVPSTGYPHFVFRPDKGDLLACGANGALYSIAFLRATGTPPIAAATQLTLATQVAQQVTSCKGLTWDAEADMIYVGLSVGGGAKIGRVVRFQQGSLTLDKDFTALPCSANGMTISGGVLPLSCVTQNNPHPTDPSMLRLDKNTGGTLGVFGKGSVKDPLNPTLANPFHPPAGLGDLACDPVTFHRDATVKDSFTDALW